MRHRALVPLLAAAALLVAAALPAAAQQSSVTGRFVHGIPDAVVDVYGNGQLNVQAFRFGTLSDPLAPQPGALHVDVLPTGAAAGTPALVNADYELSPDSDVTLAVHLTEAGAPEITRFLNGAGGLQPGQGRLTVRHIAAAPQVDVRVAEGPVLSGVGNGSEVSAEVPAGAFEITVALAGSEEPLVEPVEVEVPAGAQTIVYPVGSAEAGTLEILVQTVSGDPAVPSGVPSGNGGGAAPADVPRLLGATAVLAALGTCAAAIRLARAAR